MTIWLVLEANNYDDDIYISEPVYSEEEAKQRLLENYQSILDEFREEHIERSNYDGDSYSILCCDSDYFYGIVSSINIKEH